MLAAAGLACVAGPAWADGLGQTILATQSAGVLVMPFDATSGHKSFQIVTRIGGQFSGLPVATHWVFYAADCRHLADVTISLTEKDTVVVDPTHFSGEIQTTNPPENHPVGATVDLSGERGIAVVTAFDPQRAIAPVIVGGWTIANLGTSSSFGGDAIGVSADGALPDPAILDGGITIQTFNPSTLTDSEVILIGLESDGGSIHPIDRPLPGADGANVCCAASVTDNLEASSSIPDVCFSCVGFTAVSAALAGPDGTALLPSGVMLDSAGFVELRNCFTAAEGGGTAPIGRDAFEQFLVALHGQAVGPFGVVIVGKYSRFSPI
ncbi:MAG TPA: hypothetical protein VGK30_01835 [Candidatus Binatia bacterium]